MAAGSRGIQETKGAKLMKSVFSKKCHVIGRYVFDHLPYDQIETYFSTNPPKQLIEMYRTFGRGTLCGMFEVNSRFEVVSIDTWGSIWSDEGCDSEVCEVIHAGTRLGIGYGMSGNYYMLDFDRNNFVMRENLEELLLFALDERLNSGPAHFPFFITAAASQRAFEVKVGKNFFDQCCMAVIPDLSIRYFFDHLGMHNLIFDRSDRFMAVILSGKGLEPEGLPRLSIYYDNESGMFDINSVFKVVTEISAGEFQVVKEVF